MLGAAEIHALLERHGLDARKSLGQNFVADPNTVERIATLAGVGAGCKVVEIGPGLGSLSLALARTGASVLAVEKDATLLPALAEVLASRPDAAVEVVEADALTVDWSALLDRDEWSLVANLPYNVAVPLVMSVLRDAPMVQRLLVMVQTEVAQRLAAGPGGRTIGIPSIQLGWYANAEIVGTVAPEVFIPRPRVSSSLLRITRHDPPSTSVTADQVMELVATAYRQRRKMLRSTLAGRVDAAAYSAAGVEPTARPEELGVEQWTRLTEAAHR